MEILYVVETQFFNGEWGICDFANKTEYCSTNYFVAHKLKRELQIIN